MGLFSRNESATGSGRRSSQSSEAQAGELRARARRRLVGALALVLAAVIVVPMLFDEPVAPEQTSAPVVIPAIQPPPAPDATVALSPEPANPTASEGTTLPPETPLPAETPSDTDTVPSVATPSTEADSGTASHTPAKQPEPVAQEKPKPIEKPAVKPAAKSTERTDDGSVAIALLEGRTPAKSTSTPAASKGNFTLQIAAYGTDKDAQTRKDRLVASGVTNAYVESATSGGKATYRLRVGPFPTREAAQAAQARLRALGYDNGFISTK